MVMDRSVPNFLLSQTSVTDDDLFGSGDDDDKKVDDKRDDDDVFTLPDETIQRVKDGARHSDQISSEDSGSSAEYRRDLYSKSRESDNLDGNGKQRSSSLPDIVPKVIDSDSDSLKERKQNLSDNSPDVVYSSENKSSSSSGHIQEDMSISILRQKSSDGVKHKHQRSVSFQQTTENQESDDDSSSDAKTKRQQFRSSGYGTGSDKASSTHSQGSQASSVFDASFTLGTSTESDVMDGGCIHVAEVPYSGELFGLPVSKDIVSPSSTESDSEKVTVKSVGAPLLNPIPFLSGINMSNITMDTPPNTQDIVHERPLDSNSSVEIPPILHSNSSIEIPPILPSNSSNDSVQIPNFDILLCERGSSSGGSSSDPSDHLKHVQKKYCKVSDYLSKSPPPFATFLPSPNMESVDTGIFSRGTSDPDNSRILPSDEFDYKSCKELMTREILQQQYISENYILELIKSPITPSPRDYTYILQQRITSETIERSSRCHDYSCETRFCHKVREGFIGLENTLEGQWPYGTSADVCDLCSGLGKHATAPCDEVKCAVKWCYFLSKEFDDTPRGEFVYRALKRQYDTPSLSVTIFPPSLRPSMFLKLDEHYRRDHPKYGETITGFGEYNNVFLMEDCNVIKKIKLQESDCDLDHSIYTRLCNRQHKHIVDHVWVAVYRSVQEIHVCTSFFRGGTLEDLLQMRTLLNPVIVQSYILQILDALAYLHNKCGIIYLYWTTSNMLFLDPIRRHILISNLSLSIPRDTEFDMGYIKQSLPPCIVPPEMINNMDVDCKTDCWGLGCMMIEMLTGKQMWYNERHDTKMNLLNKIKNKDISSESYIPKHRIPAIFYNVLSRCLEYDKAKRMSCEEIHFELKSWKYN